MDAIVDCRVLTKQVTPLEPCRIGHAAAGRFTIRIPSRKFGCPSKQHRLQPVAFSRLGLFNYHSAEG